MEDHLSLSQITPFAAKHLHNWWDRAQELRDRDRAQRQSSIETSVDINISLSLKIEHSFIKNKYLTLIRINQH